MGTGHSPAERDCKQRHNATLFPLLGLEVAAGRLTLSMVWGTRWRLYLLNLATPSQVVVKHTNLSKLIPRL